jgi:hypothetical protein
VFNENNDSVFLLLISSAALILAQTAHIQPVQAKRQCETNEDGERVCTGGQGGCFDSGDETRCGGDGGRQEQGSFGPEFTNQGGSGGRTESDSGESIQGGSGGRIKCTFDPDTNTQVCERAGSSYN